MYSLSLEYVKLRSYVSQVRIDGSSVYIYSSRLKDMLAPPQVRIHASSVHLYSLRLEYMFAPVICILSG